MTTAQAQATLNRIAAQGIPLDDPAYGDRAEPVREQILIYATIALFTACFFLS
jgi:hypothetical protein